LFLREAVFGSLMGFPLLLIPRLARGPNGTRRPVVYSRGLHSANNTYPQGQFIVAPGFSPACASLKASARSQLGQRAPQRALCGLGKYEKRMKIAYLDLVHTNPGLLKRLIRTLSTDDCAFFIHIDAKSKIEQFSGLGRENVFLSEQRLPVRWGEFSQVEATMLLMRQALGSSAKYDYFVLMQGRDYPLRSSKYIQRFLEENRGTEFISLVKMPAPGFPMFKINQLRYPSDTPVRHFASMVLCKVGIARRDYKKHLVGLDAYAGDACWALSREACQYIVEFVQRNPHVERFFRHTFTPDETFFHTILGNSPFRLRVRRSLLYRDMPLFSHPLLINDAHLRFFGEREKVWVQDMFGSGEVLFARKFSDDNLNIVDRIDAMIKQKELNS